MLSKLAWFLFAAGSVLAATPDCVVSFNLNTAGQTSAVLSNRQTGCVEWTVTYNAQGFSALSLLVQSAPDAGATPGAWAAFDGTTNIGVNPNTATDQAFSTFTGYNPWMRIELTAATGTGTVVGSFYGYREAQSSSGGAVPVPLEIKGCGPIGDPPACDPVVTAGVDQNGDVVIPLLPNGAAAASMFTGAAYETDFNCATPAAITLSASGLTQIVALTAAQVIRVCHVSMSGDAAVNLKFSTGTGSNCGTGTADLTGLYYGINSLALDFSNHAALRVPAGQALCVSLSGTANWGGVVIYAKY